MTAKELVPENIFRRVDDLLLLIRLKGETKLIENKECIPVLVVGERPEKEAGWIPTDEEVVIERKHLRPKKLRPGIPFLHRASRS